MPQVHIVADARWLLHVIANIIAWTLVVLIGVYLVAGLWWTLAVTAVLTLLVVIVWRGVLR